MSENNALTRSTVQPLKLKERISYSLTNTGQTMIYALFTNFLMMYMTDYMFKGRITIYSPQQITSITALIILVARMFDAFNDPIMGQILDRTHTRWGKCRPYMLFTPIPLAIITALVFIPMPLKDNALIAYAAIIYIIFTMVYTANDIPFWSMSAVMTNNEKDRVKVVTLTRIIGGLGSAICIGLFWTVKGFFEKINVSDNTSFFLAAMVFTLFGTGLMLQGFFNTKERAPVSKEKKENIIANLAYIFKCKPLLINLISGMLVSIMTVGTVALTTYFVKWNLKTIFPDMSSTKLLSVFTPIVGFLPAIATLGGLLFAPILLKKYEKRTLLIFFTAIGLCANIISYFVGYANIYLFLIGRFFAFLPMGIWSSITTIMIGDSVDLIEYKTGRRIEGTCFSLLTFIGKFQNGVNASIALAVLGYFGYNGHLDPEAAGVNQSPKTLSAIFIMVTLVAALGYLLMIIPFLFYKFNKKQHQEILEVLEIRRREAAEKEAAVG
ncbi:MAG: hypothetical protein EOM87_00065 [Clostridia bacterium]|nr:hypothetical protein [Clostridia bacterium]